MNLFPSLRKTIERLPAAELPTKRKEPLEAIAKAMREKKESNEPVNLVFICTHNSRRSHFAQIWAQTLAEYYHLSLGTFSGGTEETRIFPSVIHTLQRQGFQIETLCDADNPLYQISYSPNAHPVIGFSKTYDHSFNPSSNFIAVMTCSSADANCPFVGGASHRISLPYNDPKEYDGSGEEAEQYAATSLRIGAELAWAFKQLQS